MVVLLQQVEDGGGGDVVAGVDGEAGQLRHRVGLQDNSVTCVTNVD